MPPIYAAHIAIDTLNLLIGAYVFWKNPRNIVHRIFFLFVFCVVGWSGSMLFLAWTGGAWLATVAFLSAEGVVAGFFLLAETFPDRRSIRAKSVIALVPWLGFVLLTLAGFVIRGARAEGGGYLRPEYGPLFPFYAFAMGSYIVWSVIILFRKYRRLEGIRRVQIRYLGAGIGIFLGLAFVSNVFLPWLGVFRFNFLGPLFSVVFVGATAYAIVRHQFMDIRFAIQRGLLYAFAVSVITVVFFAVDFGVQQIVDQSTLSAVIAASLGAFGFLWIRRSFEKITDHIFFRRDYDYAAAVQRLGPLLNATIDLDELLALIDGFLTETIKPARVIFYMKKGDDISPARVFRHEQSGSAGDEGEYEGEDGSAFFETREILFIQEWEEAPGERRAIRLARKRGLAVIAPLPGRDGAAAVMLLGKKRSDDIFRTKDIALLSVLAHQAAMAIENARLYEGSKRYGEELERRVAERTAEIRGMQEAQSQFLADISHELQTPVAVLKGNLEMLGRDRRPEAKPAFAVMSATLDRMAQLISDLLAVAKLNFSKNKLHKTRVAVEDILETAYHDCEILAESKDIRLSYESDSSAVSGDKDKLKEVILNLISNALKHTPPGGTIALSACCAGQTAKIVVEDTGAGIAPEALPHIFERFYRIKNGEGCSTGLGLDICRKIIEAHSGGIEVASQPGKGSRFTISLPMYAPKDETTLL